MAASPLDVNSLTQWTTKKSKPHQHAQQVTCYMPLSLLFLAPCCPVLSCPVPSHVEIPPPLPRDCSGELEEGGYTFMLLLWYSKLPHVEFHPAPFFFLIEKAGSGVAGESVAAQRVATQPAEAPPGLHPDRGRGYSARGTGRTSRGAVKRGRDPQGEGWGCQIREGKKGVEWGPKRKETNWVEKTQRNLSSSATCFLAVTPTHSTGEERGMLFGRHPGRECGKRAGSFSRCRCGFFQAIALGGFLVEPLIV